MIKVNLLKTKVVSQSLEGEDVPLSVESGVSAGSSSQKEVLLKLLVILAGVIVLIIFEQVNISNLTKEKDAVTGKVNLLQTEKRQLEERVKAENQLKADINQLEEKQKILNRLLRKRMQELKALDFLQTSLPEGVWLDSIDYNGLDVEFKGFAATDRDLSMFVEILEKSAHFNQVLLAKSVENKNKTGTVKEFTINAELGAAN